MTMPKPHAALNWMTLATLGLLLAACGSSDSKVPTATGQAQTDAAVAGTVTLNDAAMPSQSRSAPMAADGSFTVPVAGLTAPYLLRVQWTDVEGASRTLYGVAEGNENLDVDGFSDMGYGSACTEKGKGEADDFDNSSGDGKRDSANKSRALLQKLLDGPLAPLFTLYGITDVRRDRAEVRALLRDVRVNRDDGIVTVTNRATGLVVFVGELRNLDGGTFTAANMPAGPGGGATCTDFTYSDFGACQPDNTQSRTVLTSLPAGCTGGSPVTTQACTFVPPIDGAALYTQLCAGCHGNSKKGRPASATLAAINANVGGMGSATLRALTQAQLDAIAAAP